MSARKFPIEPRKKLQKRLSKDKINSNEIRWSSVEIDPLYFIRFSIRRYIEIEVSRVSDASGYR